MKSFCFWVIVVLCSENLFVYAKSYYCSRIVSLSVESRKYVNFLFLKVLLASFLLIAYIRLEGSIEPML